MNQLVLESVRVADIEIEIAGADLLPFRFERGDLSGLTASIKRFGLLVPPVLWHTQETGHHRWVVIDGSRRVAVLQDLKLGKEDTIIAAIFRGERVAAQRLSAVIHLGVAQNNRGDEAVAAHWLETLERDKWPQKKMAELADRDQTWVTHSKTFATELAPTILERFRRQTTATPKSAVITAKLAQDLAKMTTGDGKKGDGKKGVGKKGDGKPDAAKQEAEMDQALKDAEARPKKRRGR